MIVVEAHEDVYIVQERARVGVRMVGGSGVRMERRVEERVRTFHLLSTIRYEQCVAFQYVEVARSRGEMLLLAIDGWCKKYDRK